AVSAAPGSGLTADAQERWPTRNITMIVPYPPGGQADFAGRPIAEALGKVLGRGVVVANRRGGGGRGGRGRHRGGGARRARRLHHPDEPAGDRGAAGGRPPVRPQAVLRDVA